MADSALARASSQSQAAFRTSRYMRPSKRWPDGLPECQKQFTCKTCKETFRPKRAGRTQFCSRSCAYEWRRIVAKLTKRAVVKTIRRPPAEQKPQPVKQCRDCGCVVAKGKQRCDACRQSRIAKNRAKALERATQDGRRSARRKARKLLIRGVTVESVNPIEVLKRDGWTCQICGVRTPKKLRGSYDDRAPEVDHIIPIAAGGEHSNRNTQCACRKCNIAKSDMPLGQLRLIG